jgi:dihydrodipicolinate synthase/N-acetylneuraminate lyase
MTEKLIKKIPEVVSPLRSSIIEMPDIIRKASGIVIYGKRIKSIVYSLDVSLIANTDADAILCVYPFTPNTQILNAVSLVAKAPILVGVGGGLTQGERSARLASHAEENNATAIVLNGPVTVETTEMVRQYVDIPIIYTVIDKSRELQPYIDAGVNIFNVSGGANTVELVKWVREQYPDMPIIASGGKTDESIEATINAGANAITYTAYGMMEQYFHEKMETYRN